MKLTVPCTIQCQEVSILVSTKNDNDAHGMGRPKEVRNKPESCRRMREAAIGILTMSEDYSQVTSTLSE